MHPFFCTSHVHAHILKFIASQPTSQQQYQQQHKENERWQMDIVNRRFFCEKLGDIFLLSCASAFDNCKFHFIFSFFFLLFFHFVFDST